MDQLLESFAFPEGSVSAVHVFPERSLLICLAIKQFQRSQTGSTRVLLAEYQEQAGGTHGVLKTYVSNFLWLNCPHFFIAVALSQLVQHVLETLKAVHLTSKMEVIMGCENGDLTIVSKNAIPQRIFQSRQCQNSKSHGSLMYMHYVEQIHTLVMGFNSGLLHVLSVTDMPNLFDAFTRGFCGSVDNGLHTNSFLVVYPISSPAPSSPSSSSSTIMEIWCGQNNNSITVWQLSERDRARQWRAA